MNEDTGFILDTKNDAWFCEHLAKYHLVLASCEYNLEVFKDSLFSTFNVAFPLSLSRAVDKRKAEFLAGRVCASHAMERIGFAPVTVEIGEQREPLWPDTIIGSISHDPSHACAVLGKKGPVKGLGIDIQSVIAPDVVEDIHDKIVTEQELNLIVQAGFSKQQGVSLVFSAKESFFKGVFSSVGRYFGFETLVLYEVMRDEKTLVFNVQQDLTDSLAQGARVQVYFEEGTKDAFISLFIYT